MSEQESTPPATNSMLANVQDALASERIIHPAMKGLAQMTIAKQLGIMLILAVSIAISVAVVLWSDTPSYARLFAEIGPQDTSDIITYLDTLEVKYKVEPGSGAILVPMDKVNELKIKLAGQGLPRSKSLGYELLDKDQSIGASKNVELMRFQRALEGEIAQTLSSIQNIKSARVLLALPVQSVFIRERKKPSASVMVNLYQGRSLSKEQIESIIHLVASSVPQLEAEQVTVVDQKGRLLNSKESSLGYLTAKQFDYKKDLEEHLMERIANIMAPLVGDGMRTQISADVDFTEMDKTQENFDPKNTVLRSEQSSEENNSLPGTQGIPGALSNQPTASGSSPETTQQQKPTTPGQNQSTTSNTNTTPASSSKNATKNFEVDKTITHTRSATGLLKRLSVAVVVDNKHSFDAEGKPKSDPYNQEEIDRFTNLVKQAVGFDNERGDQVTVTNVAFKAPDALEALPELPLWEQLWFIDAMKKLAAALAVLFLIFGVLRPAMRRLAGRSEEEIKAEIVAEHEAEVAKEKEIQAQMLGSVDAQGRPVQFDENGVPIATPADDDLLLQANKQAVDMLLLDTPQTYESRLEYVKKLVDNDSQLVAEVIKTWIK
jgi:flagellar M-ring protein FliF